MDGTQSFDLIVAIFALLAWYLGIYQTVESEAADCIKRIEKLEEWQKQDRIPAGIDVEKAVKANRRPLNLFRRESVRFVLVWAPSISLIIANTCVLITMGLEQNVVGDISQLVVRVAFIAAGIALLLSLALLMYAFREHPEARYIEIFLQLTPEGEQEGNNTSAEKSLGD